MLVLSIDSAGSSCGVCVWQGGRVLAQAKEEMARGQDARLLPMILSTLEQSGLTFADLDKIAVTRGPGSFTGVRVGLAAARGIGLASDKPVLGIDRFAIYRAAHNAPERNLLVVIDSKRAELFCKFFPAIGAAHEACLMTQEQIDAFVAEHPDTIISGDRATPDTEVTAISARLAASADALQPDFRPNPLYLRAPDVTFSKASSAR